MTEISVRLFGAFRDLCEAPELSLKLSDGLPSIEIVRAALFEALLPGQKGARRPLSESELRALIARSALADEARILKPGDAIAAGARLAILPPVCGG